MVYDIFICSNWFHTQELSAGHLWKRRCWPLFQINYYTAALSSASISFASYFAAVFHFICNVLVNHLCWIPGTGISPLCCYIHVAGFPVRDLYRLPMLHVLSFYSLGRWTSCELDQHSDHWWQGIQTAHCWIYPGDLCSFATPSSSLLNALFLLWIDVTIGDLIRQLF